MASATMHRLPSLRARARATAAATLAAAVVALAIAGLAHAGPAERDACRMRDIPAADIVARVPFELIDGRIHVQARVNGRGPFRFAVDTGASGVARADAKLVSALDLPPQGTATNSDGMHAATVETVRIDTLELGGLARKRVEAIAREFFADGLLVIDYPARTLTFSRAQTLSPGDANALAYQRAFRVPVSIGALRTEGNIDTGANVALVMPTALYDRIDAGPLQAAGRGDLANGKVETQRAVVHGPLRIGGLELAEAEARVSERYPELLVGAYALQQSTLVIDQRSRRIAVCPD